MKVTLAGNDEEIERMVREKHIMKTVGTPPSAPMSNSITVKGKQLLLEFGGISESKISLHQSFTVSKKKVRSSNTIEVLHFFRTHKSETAIICLDLQRMQLHMTSVKTTTKYVRVGKTKN